jgi:hypothetical protein
MFCDMPIGSEMSAYRGRPEGTGTETEGRD